MAKQLHVRLSDLVDSSLLLGSHGQVNGLGLIRNRWLRVLAERQERIGVKLLVVVVNLGPM